MSTLALELETSVKMTPSNDGIHQLGADEAGKLIASGHRSAIELADKVGLGTIWFYTGSLRPPHQLREAHAAISFAHEQEELATRHAYELGRALRFYEKMTSGEI